MRVWIDITNSPHVLVLPAADRAAAGARARRRRDGARVRADAGAARAARDRARGRRAAPRRGRRRRERPVRSPAGCAALRTLREAAAASTVALSHGSHELTLDRPPPRNPERVRVRLRVRVAPAPPRLPRRDARRRARRDPAGAARATRRPAAASSSRYPGLKEEYYLAGFEPDPRCSVSSGIDRERVLAVVRTPPDVSLYHRHGNPLFASVLERLGRGRVRARGRAPANDRAARGDPRRSRSRLCRPEHAVDAQSLVALADLVVSAGGTMNREAVALGVPVYTTFAGRIGAVDERCCAKGVSALLTDPRTLDAREARSRATERGRDRRFLELLLDRPRYATQLSG